jgi:hypothetical protein
VECNRTHRERKEAYTKSLELEVVQLRANEAKILQETKRLYTELTALKRLLAENGIQVPPIFDQGQPGLAVSVDVRSHEETFDLSIQVTNSKQKQRRIQLQNPQSGPLGDRYEHSAGSQQGSSPRDLPNSGRSLNRTLT